MAGSYNHVIDRGVLGSNEYVVSMLENGGDVFETVEEMYGMIHFLADRLSEAIEVPRESLVEQARQNCAEGLHIGGTHDF